MERFLVLQKSSRCRKYATSVLAFSWMLGLSLGFSAVISGVFASAFRQVANVSPSFLSIISVLLFPVVVSFLAVFAGMRWLIFPLVFLKAIAFAYVGWSVVITFGSAGWLLRLLIMFSDCACIPLFLWFWNRAINSEFDSLLPAFFVTILITLGVGLIDYCVISPFLASLTL